MQTDQIQVEDSKPVLDRNGNITGTYDNLSPGIPAPDPQPNAKTAGGDAQRDDSQLTTELNDATDGSSRISEPMPRQCDWDLFHERKSPPVPIEKLLDAFRCIRDFKNDCIATAQKKKSFILQNGKKDTWGTMVNKDLAQAFGVDGPHAYHWDKDIEVDPPNWTQTILALRSDKFGRTQEKDGGHHYKGYVGAYRVTLTDAEYRRLEGYCTRGIPTLSDWSCELEESEEILKVFTDGMRCISDSRQFDAVMGIRIEEIKKYLKPEAGSLFPKGSLPPKRAFEYNENDRETEETRQLAAKRRVRRRPEHPGEISAGRRYDKEPPGLHNGEQGDDATRSSEYGPALTPSSESGMTLRSAIPGRKPVSYNLSNVEDPSTEDSSLRREGLLHEPRPNNLNSSRGATPVSTQDNRIERTPDERRFGPGFIHKLATQKLKWEEMRPIYKERFGVWRTAAAMRNMNREYLDT